MGVLVDTEELIADLAEYEEDEEEQQRRLKRKQRIEDMKRRKRKAQIMHQCVMGVAVMVVLLAGIGMGAAVRIWLAGSSGEEEEGQIAGLQGESGEAGSTEMSGAAEPGPAGALGPAELAGGVAGASGAAESAGEEGSGVAAAEVQNEQKPLFSPYSTEATVRFGENIISEYGVLMEADTGEILAARDAGARINPASMTKILTVLTAAEALGIDSDDAAVLADTFVMTIEITDYTYVNDCSIAGFAVGEETTLRDLFYGTILPSGADAAVGLATYVAGSHEAFVEMMNQKLEEMGIEGTTHFENCVGLYGENHYSTAQDMAVILKAAVSNPFCRQVLSAHTYNTSLTEEHPEGILLSNWFLRRIEDRDTHGEVLCGKTGYVDQSGSCAASLAADVDGREYLCVTAGANSPWRCIADQTELFQNFLRGED